MSPNLLDKLQGAKTKTKTLAKLQKLDLVHGTTSAPNRLSQVEFEKTAGGNASRKSGFNYGLVTGIASDATTRAGGSSGYAQSAITGMMTDMSVAENSKTQDPTPVQIMIEAARKSLHGPRPLDSSPGGSPDSGGELLDILSSDGEADSDNMNLKQKTANTKKKAGKNLVTGTVGLSKAGAGVGMMKSVALLSAKSKLAKNKAKAKGAASITISAMMSEKSIAQTKKNPITNPFVSKTLSIAAKGKAKNKQGPGQAKKQPLMKKEMTDASMTGGSQQNLLIGDGDPEQDVTGAYSTAVGGVITNPDVTTLQEDGIETRDINLGKSTTLKSVAPKGTKMAKNKFLAGGVKSFALGGGGIASSKALTKKSGIVRSNTMSTAAKKKNIPTKVEDDISGIGPISGKEQPGED